MEEPEEDVQEALQTENFFNQDSNASPLFPSPSSSFRPPPNLDIDIVLSNKLDQRILLEREKRESGIESGQEEIIYDVTPTPLSPLFPVHPVLHPDPNSKLSQLDTLNLNVSEFSTSAAPDANQSGLYTPKTLAGASNNKNFNSFIFIRDFAFKPEDPRFSGGRHPDQDLKFSSNSSSSTRLGVSGTGNDLEREFRERVSPKVGNEEFSASGSSGCKF